VLEGAHTWLLVSRDSMLHWLLIIFRNVLYVHVAVLMMRTVQPKC